MDSEQGVVVGGNGQRLTTWEAEQVREAQRRGQVVAFANRHQWRHFQRHP